MSNDSLDMPIDVYCAKCGATGSADAPLIDEFIGQGCPVCHGVIRRVDETPEETPHFWSKFWRPSFGSLGRNN